MKLSKPKYIFVTGGVASSLGKGIISASIARLLQARGYSVTIQKLDPYINIDPGTLNPYEHGECYVTEDGAETDLDLGHYERFTSITTSHANNVTTGKIYQCVIDKERKGEYLGKTVQVIPHITDEIKRRIQLLAQRKEYDVIITEIGGTVGDIESLPFIESVRQLRYQLGARNTALVHLTLIPYLAASGELKTKPTQHSVKTLLENGLQPDILVLRTEHPLSAELRRKVALFCNVDANAVMESIDVPTIYEVPLVMHRQHLDEVVLSKLDLPSEQEPDLSSLQAFVDKVKNPKRTIDIALVGKYTELPDAYKSICESFIQAGAVNDCKVKLHYVNSEKIDASNVGEKLGKMAGILVAPGFGNRGIEGKIEAVHFARTHRIPFLGICLGMQCAVIEFARNVLGFKDATSTEMDPATKHPVIDLMEEQKGITAKGGTMRLGAYPCSLEPGSKAAQAYGTTQIQERHRHRYEFNSEYLKDFESHGMKAVGANPDTGLVEVVEVANHPWFVGVQYHPEVNHTEFGTAMIRNFLYEVCGATGDWTMGDFMRKSIEDIRAKVGDGKVLLALSGGVDSSVAAALLAEAVGPQLTCVFVDHGLMRLNEGDEVEAAFKKWDINFVRVNAEGRFLSKLAGISDPERKRKIIGEEFIRVFEEESKKIGAVDFLAQGTIYPDVIESGLGNAAVIKSHHNVGGLPDYVDFKEIIEPLRLLFKDEVRQLGRELGLPEYLVSRQPFPGPGLAIRIMGEITKEKADTLRLADAIYREELEKAGENKKMNQYFAVLTDTRTVGVMGDGRSYDRVLALRAVTTEDFMTADWARIPYELLDKISGRIVNEVKGINRIVYDITSKPPATVEWE